MATVRLSSRRLGGMHLIPPQRAAGCTRSFLPIGMSLHHDCFPKFLVTPVRGFVEHSTDPNKWRNPETAEIKRQYRGGIPLGSEAIRQREMEKRLVEEDFVNWNLVVYVAIAMVLLLVGLNLVMEFVEPVPSPEYVPYEYPQKEEASVHETSVCTTMRER
ncbi:unnamed protein product [Phytomonas sp. EM1]|nr:unnamed protein product [Phytomonas sp. EM1]|eukprot:CCW59656.1 unnamed protein product [Phytomonas sp. isolate EM1]